MLSKKINCQRERGKKIRRQKADGSGRSASIPSIERKTPILELFEDVFEEKYCRYDQYDNAGSVRSIEDE